jgi:hypothetical protein
MFEGFFVHAHENANEGWLKLKYDANNKGHEKIISRGSPSFGRFRCLFDHGQQRVNDAVQRPKPCWLDGDARRRVDD